MSCSFFDKGNADDCNSEAVAALVLVALVSSIVSIEFIQALTLSDPGFKLKSSSILCFFKLPDYKYQFQESNDLTSIQIK